MESLGKTRTPARAIRRILLALILALALALPTAQATTLTGTFTQAGGAAVGNGKLILRLKLPAVNTVLSQQVANTPVVCSLNLSGTITGTCTVHDNAELTPKQYYEMTLYNSNTERVLAQNWYITGATVDVATLQPTTIGISFPNPLTNPVTANLLPNATGLDLGSASARWDALFEMFQWYSGASFPGIFSHVNTANRTYTFPDATGNIPSLPTAATTETGTGAIVRQTSPNLITPTIGGVAAATVNNFTRDIIPAFYENAVATTDVQYNYRVPQAGMTVETLGCWYASGTPTGTSTFDFRRNGTSIGTVNLLSSTAINTWVENDIADVALTLGDRLSFAVTAAGAHAQVTCGFTVSKRLQ